jgi:hypothetical protein
VCSRDREGGDQHGYTAEEKDGSGECEESSDENEAVFVEKENPDPNAEQN